MSTNDQDYSKGVRQTFQQFDICPSCGTNWDNATACCSKEKKLESENKRLHSEVERLSGKTGFCAQCETYARENERLREGLKNIKKHYEIIDPKSPHMYSAYAIAKSALEDKK